MSVETCAHYLTFAAEDIPDGDTRFKCATPLRESEVLGRLWQGLQVRPTTASNVWLESGY